MLPSATLVAFLRPQIVRLTSVPSRCINMDKLTNKRINRLESDIELDHPQFKSRLINRNPRNLEQLSYEAKPTGFWLDKSPRSTWNRLMFEPDGRHLRAYLMHWSGKKLVEASTREANLRKYFVSPGTTQSATTLAQIFARRCLQSGYHCAGAIDLDENTSIKTRAFYEAVQASGFVIEEPPEIVPRYATDI